MSFLRQALAHQLPTSDLIALRRSARYSAVAGGHLVVVTPPHFSHWRCWINRQALRSARSSFGSSRFFLKDASMERPNASSRAEAPSSPPKNAWPSKVSANSQIASHSSVLVPVLGSTSPLLKPSGSKPGGKWSGTWDARRAALGISSGRFNNLSSFGPPRGCSDLESAI